MTRRRRRRTQKPRALAADLHAAWAARAGRWVARRQRLIDHLGVRAFTRKRRLALWPPYLTMAGAALLLCCSPAAARKRLQREKAQLLRVGGRWLVPSISVRVQLPNFGLNEPERRLGTSDVAKVLKGRGGRALSVQGTRKWLRRHDLAHKNRGRWIVSNLFAISAKVELQRECEPSIATSGRIQTTNNS